jgi:uncharacterized membrane protein YfcA
MVGAIKAWRDGLLDIKTGFLFALPSFVGVYLVRAFVMPNLPEIIYHSESFVFTKALLIMMVFAVLMVTSSLMMIKKKLESKKIDRYTMAKMQRNLGELKLRLNKKAEALSHFENALVHNEKIGVKKLIASLKKELE